MSKKYVGMSKQDQIANQILEKKKIYIIYVNGPFLNSFLRDWLMEQGSQFDEEIDQDDMGKSEIFPYAYTASKKVLNKFMKYRNVERFIIAKKRFNDVFKGGRDDIVKFVSESSFMEIDVNYPVITRSCRESSKTTCIRLPITHFEKEFIETILEADDDLMYQLFESNEYMEIIIKTLKPSIQKNMKIVGIPLLTRYTDQVYRSNSSNISYDVSCDLDEYSMFMEYFGELF